jgi:hypothetical protein
MRPRASRPAPGSIGICAPPSRSRGRFPSADGASPIAHAVGADRRDQRSRHAASSPRCQERSGPLQYLAADGMGTGRPQPSHDRRRGAPHPPAAGSGCARVGLPNPAHKTPTKSTPPCRAVPLLPLLSDWPRVARSTNGTGRATPARSRAAHLTLPSTECLWQKLAIRGVTRPSHGWYRGNRHSVASISSDRPAKPSRKECCRLNSSASWPMPSDDPI